MGHFYYAVKAFEALEKIDSENDYEDALRGSVLGVFQMVVAGKESVEHLIEAAAILKSVENSQQVLFGVCRMTGSSRLSRSGARRTIWTSMRLGSDLFVPLSLYFGLGVGGWVVDWSILGLGR